MNKKLLALLGALIALALVTMACGPLDWVASKLGYTPAAVAAAPAVAPTLVVPPASGIVPTLAPAAPGAGSSGCTPPAGYTGYWAVPAGCPVAPAPTLIPAVPTAVVPAPTVAAPAPTGAPIAACMPGARFTQLKNAAFSAYPNDLDARITSLIVSMNTEYDTNHNLGYRSERPGMVIENPGAMTVSWTDLGGSDITLPRITSTAPGGLSANWVPLVGLTKNPAGRPDLGWGFRAVFTSLEMKTGFTAIRLCEVTVAW